MFVIDSTCILVMILVAVFSLILPSSVIHVVVAKGRRVASRAPVQLILVLSNEYLSDFSYTVLWLVVSFYSLAFFLGT